MIVKSRDSSRVVIDTFKAGVPDVTYTFHGDEVRKTAWITLENNSYVDTATMLVRGQTRTDGTTQYPFQPEVDFGDDGDIEWAFSYTGSGKMGYQNGLSNESRYNRMDVKAGVDDTSTTFRLPINATVTDATLNIEGVFRFKEQLVINGTANQDELGTSLAFVGDLDGDTIPDFAVGVPQNDTATYSDAGKVMIYFGGAGIDPTPDLEIEGTNVSDQYGYNIAPAGDVNNDGYDDLLVGTPFNDTAQTSAGRVYIYYGGDPMDTTVDVTMTGEEVGNFFGVSATGVGDINDDGYDDVVSTSPNWGFAVGETFNQYGKMYFYLGGDPMDNVADLVVQGPHLQSTWGWDIAPVGDFNNDGYDDFVMGTFSNDVACSNCGKVELFLGDSPIDGTIDLTIYGNGGEEFGYSVAPLGDINKDGFDDFVTGAINNDVHGSKTGAAYVYFGGNALDGNADLTIHGHAKGDSFGCAVAPGGDINNDGWLDILVGSEGNDTAVADTGAVFVLYGNTTLDNRTDLIIPGEAAFDFFGHSLSGGVDYNKDGFSDVLTGAYKSDANATNGGRAYLFTTVPKKAIDPVLDLSGTADPPGVIWSSSGTFIDNVTVPDFKDQVNAYLANASNPSKDEYGNDYVDIGLSVGSGHNAEFVISNISISYLWDAVVDINPNAWTGDLTAELDGKIPHEDTGTTQVTLWARSRGMGRLLFHTLDIVTDEGPQLITIPTTSMDEDTHEPHLIDLYDHFDDEYDPDDYLSYEIVSFTNSDHVNVTMNDTHYVSVDALTGSLNDNWTGSTDVTVKAFDKRNLSKESNTFTVNIVEVNDPPVFNSTPVLTAAATKPYSYQAVAVDDHGPISFGIASGPTGLAVNTGSGLVTWNPASVGNYTASLEASDGDLSAFQNFTIAVSPPNDPPRITSTPGTTATVGHLYTYQLVATDPDGDVLVANITTGPGGMRMDEDWLVSYIPASDQVGDQTVTFEVSDGLVTVDQSYTLTVSDAGMNNVPFFVSTPPAIAVVGHTYDYVLVAMDDDGDTLTYSLDQAPTGMFVTDDLIEWVPTDPQFGQHTVVARVTDGMAYALQTFTVDVSRTGANHPPVIVSTPPASGKVGYTYEYQVEARDDDLDPLTFTLDTSFKRMTISEASGLLIWHPASDAAGNQTITVRVSDGMGFDIQTFVVFVESFERNGLPIFLSNPATDGKVGEAYSYQPQVQDPDNDPVTFTLVDPPDGMTIEQTTGLISWTPAQGQDGNATVEIRASDGKGYASQTFTIRVQPGETVVVLTVAIGGPKDGAEVSKNITVDGTASVNVGELFEVQVKIDDGRWYPAEGLGSWQYQIDTTSLKNGKHTIRARAWDGNIYSEVESVEIMVKNQDIEPEEKPFTMFGMDGMFFMFILILMIIIFVGIAVAVRKPSVPPPPPGRRRRDDDTPPPERRRRPGRDRYDEEPDDRYDDHREDRYEDEYDDNGDDGDLYDNEYDDAEGYDREREYDDRY